MTGEITAADYELMKSMTEAPISYLANIPDAGIPVRDTIYPVGSALSYQVRTQGDNTGRD